ncbi:MAG: hypothetical protein KME50_35145 [Nostoc desertorum CM1-VF14]|nr:hypothetical protein [Nostoc desertorum CM1-VF14]
MLRSPLLDNKLGDVYDGLRLRIKPSNPQLTIRVLSPNPDDCALIKLIYEIVRRRIACRRHRSKRSRLLLRSPLLDNKLGDVYDGLRLRIKPSNPQLTIRVLSPNPDDCALIKLIYEIVRSQ